MAEGIKAQIRKEAIRIIADSPSGIQSADLQQRIHEANSSFNKNTIRGTVWDLHVRTDTVEKPSKGLFRIVSADPEDQVVVAQKPPVIREEEFYKPFANWLKKELNNVTKAIDLGGSRFKDKWGTPDVIAKRASRASDIIELPIEIVSAEIKTDTSQLIAAFGQACAYCLFSHRSYLVVPLNTRKDDMRRLDSLCQVFGIGFVLFDAVQPDDPKFESVVRPKKQDPDIYYTNTYCKKFEQELFG